MRQKSISIGVDEKGQLGMLSRSWSLSVILSDWRWLVSHQLVTDRWLDADEITRDAKFETDAEKMMTRLDWSKWWAQVERLSNDERLLWNRRLSSDNFSFDNRR